jgi:hypothetical protein
MNASSLASVVSWKIIALAFLLSSFSSGGDVQVVAFAFGPNAANVGRSFKQIGLSNAGRFAPNKLDSPALVRSSSSRVSNIVGGSNINSNSNVPSVSDSESELESVPRWNLWKRLRNRISTPTSVAAAAAAAATGSSASSSRSSSAASSMRSGSRWMKAAAAFATFLVLRPISAIASGGGMGGGARTTPLPKLEGYVLD